MTEQDIYKLRNGKQQKGYRINEIVPFSYPFLEMRLSCLVSKVPEKDLQNLYHHIIEAILVGNSRMEDLFSFLGINKRDEFITKELFYLRDKGLLDYIDDQWVVSQLGEEYLEDESLISTEEREDFSFVVDLVSGELASNEDTGRLYPNALDRYINDGGFMWLADKDSLLSVLSFLDKRHSDLSNLYKEEHPGSYLIDYTEDSLWRSRCAQYKELWLVEYIPANQSDSSTLPYLEILNEDGRVNKKLSAAFNKNYGLYIDLLGDEDRKLIKQLAEIEIIHEAIEEEETAVSPKEDSPVRIERLGVWETKNAFIKAIKETKYRLLIESPWLSRATLEYLPAFEALLKRGASLIIIYGNNSPTKSDYEDVVINKVERLRSQYPKLYLYYLPKHLPRRGIYGINGTHRKFLIKDNDYYIDGSFNFLSFGRQEGMSVGNERSRLISIDVESEWKTINDEYKLGLEL